MKKYFFILFLFSISYSFSQERVALNGKIYIDESEEPLLGISVTNENTKKSTYTDVNGNFIIEGKESDNLTFNSFNTKSRTLNITSAMYSNRNLSVQLNIKEKILPEVNVSNSSGSLEKDVQKISPKNPTSELIKNMDLVTTGQKWDKTKSRYSNGTNDLLGIVDVISGNRKKRKRAYKYEKQMINLQNIRNYFGDDYFIDDLGFENYEIDQFLLYLYLNDKLEALYKTSDWKNIQELLINSCKSYRERKNKTSEEEQD